MKKLTAFVLSAMMVLSLAACGAKTETPADTSTPAADATKPAEVAKLTYAVEAGSAGEEVALANGYNVVSVDSQAKALMEVQAGTADAAIIDSLMAGAMVGEGTSYPNLTITDQKLTEELYGVGCRKGSDLASFINSVMADAYADGVLEATAETYGVQAALVEQPASEFTASESDSDVQYIKDKGTLVIGITEFEPMDYQDADGNWIGFDADMAKLVAEKLGVEPEYVESDWDSLFAGLDAGRYDMVCNGVEVTEERAKTYAFTTPYGYIHTALAVRKDNTDITSFEDLKGKTTANSLASTYMELAESYGATVQGIDTLEETIQLLTAGRIDATLNADVSFYDYLNVHPDADFKLVAQTAEASHVAIPVLKSEDTAYLDALNTAIEELRANGTLKTLSEKYFGQDISSEN